MIAPSRSLSMISKDTINIAIKSLNELGLKVSFGKHVNECVDDFFSSSVKSRLDDLRCFQRENVKGILSVIGGFNSNQLLSYVDYDLIKRNPKIFMWVFGHNRSSKMQYLQKLELLLTQGHIFQALEWLRGNEYTIEYFKALLKSSSLKYLLQLNGVMTMLGF